MLLNEYGTKIIESDLKNGNLIPFLLGAPGIGKSSVVKTICEKNRWGFHELLCNQIAMQTDLTGCRTLMYTDKNGEEQAKQIFFPHAVVKEAIEDATENPDKIVVLFLDDINRTAAAVTSALLMFITARKIGTEKLPENIKFIAAGDDSGNVVSLDMASMSRFILRRCKPDATTFLGLCRIHPIIEDMLKTKPALIYQERNAVVDENDEEIFSDDENDFQQIATPRTLMGLNKAMLENGQMLMEMSESNLREYVAGFTGDTLTTEYIVTNILMNKFNLNAPRQTEAPVRPPVIDCFIGASQISDIRGLTNEEKSAAILYMVYDQSVNYISAMREVVKSYGKNMLLRDDQQKLTDVLNSGSYNHDAFEEILNSDTPLAQAFKMIYGN